MDNCRRMGMGYEVIPLPCRMQNFSTKGVLLAVLLTGSSSYALAQNAAPATSPAGISSETPLSAQSEPSQLNGVITRSNQFYGSLDLGETYSSNAGGIAGAGYSNSDEYTAATLALGLRYDSKHLHATADYSLTGQYYARFHDLNQYINRLSLIAGAEVLPDHFFLNLNAFAAPTLLNRLGAISAGGELVSSQNNTNSYGFQVQPEYIFRISDLATSTTSVSGGAIAYASPTGTNSVLNPFYVAPQSATSFNATEQIASGDYFGPLNWSLTGTYDKLIQRSETITQSDGVAHLGYAIDRSVSLLASGGYTDFHTTVPLSQNLSGPLALGGFSFTPTASFKLIAQAGVKSNHPTYNGSLQWNLSPLTSVVGELTDVITTPQGNTLGSLLGSLGSQSGYGGAFQNPPTTTISGQKSNLLDGLPLSAQGLALDNSIYRDRQASITFLHTASRTDYSLAFQAETRDRINFVAGLDPNTSIYGVTASVTRRLREDLSANVSANYSYANEFNGHDQIYNLTAGLAYKMSDTFSIYALDRYLRREENNITGGTGLPLSDNEVTFGVRRNF